MKDRVNEMFNGNFTTPQILKRCEDAGFIKEIKGRSFDNCTELAELMQSKFEDLAEELPLSCFLNAAAALFNNGVVHGTSDSGKRI